MLTLTLTLTTDAGSDSADTDTTGYCDGNDEDLADCRNDADPVFDPWIASTGEVPIWIRDQKDRGLRRLPCRRERRCKT